MRKIIAFTGMPWAGKTEAVIVATNIGLPVFRIGDIVWEEVEKRGVPVDSKNVGKIADEMRRKCGNDIWARKTYEKIKSSNITLGDVIVIDGIRSLDEVNYFKKIFGKDLIIIAITASDDIRRQRALNRNRIDDTNDFKEIKKRDERERKWGLPLVIENADYIIRNEDNIKSFQREVRKLLEIIVKR